ncbi:MAG: hypothetical protein FP831_19060, partial [Anaerolineae bacterium]|nr:hypothetical protein [Anaerolineae bacterium]
MTKISDLSYEILLKEIRCEINAQHRIEAAKFLLDNSDNSERMAFLINCLLFDPQPEVRTKVKALLFEFYGNELEAILKVEGMDGTPIENPWM